MNKVLVFSCLTAFLVVADAMAEGEAFQASLTPDCAIHDRSTRIEGLTLSIWGENPQAALSIGLVNGATGESSGLSLGILNYAESYAGAQWAVANFTEGNCSGWQGGPCIGLLGSIVNYTGGHMRGLQTGVVNLSGQLSGLQLGLINYTQLADEGVQVGLVNIIAQNNGWFTNWPNEVAPGMVLVNWRF